MKLSNLLLFLTSAAASYHLVSKKDEISQGASETIQVSQKLQGQIARLQENLARVQKESLHLQDVVEDINYQTQVFSKVAEAKAQEIQNIWQDK